MMYDLVVIGGGAAGFFGAINAAEMRTGQRILILEKSTKLLSKVKISGGGRCNVTHHCLSAATLSQHYPRGQKQLKKLFHEFQSADTVSWFATHGVTLKTEEDGRMFPESDNSQTIIDCFLTAAQKNNIQIEVSKEVVAIASEGNQFTIETSTNRYMGKKILVAVGGFPKEESYRWLAQLGHSIIKPIPSLFTFNDSAKDFSALMGVAVAQAEVKIAGTKITEKGPVLLTHWGLSGPAVIKLSAWAAEYLFQKNYTFLVLVNWAGIPEATVRELLMDLKKDNSRKTVVVNSMFGLPKRLWEHLCYKSEIEPHKTWAELTHKSINRLIELVTACAFQIRGKTTFKEEFVTCGGIDVSQVNIASMESKILPGLYFAGEVLNVDGETGGFNFQAAWATAYTAARSIAGIKAVEE